MLVTINGEQEDLPITFRRDAAHFQEEQLYVDDRRVTRVTHSRSDDIPVMVQADELLIEVAPRDFYNITGMHHDWQPGDQAQSLGSA